MGHSQTVLVYRLAAFVSSKAGLFGALELSHAPSTLWPLLSAQVAMGGRRMLGDVHFACAAVLEA